jgi:hypothetical protein
MLEGASDRMIWIRCFHWLYRLVVILTDCGLECWSSGDAGGLRDWWCLAGWENRETLVCAFSKTSKIYDDPPGAQEFFVLQLSIFMT